MEKLDINFALKTDSPNKNEELEILINRDEKEFFKSFFIMYFFYRYREYKLCTVFVI